MKTKSEIQKNNTPFILLFWPFFLIAQLIASSFLAWQIGAQTNFGYSLGYSLLNIEQHIQTYAPQNIYKSDFVFTTQTERFKLFEKTVSAIQNSGKGLELITYELPNRTQAQLYTPAEITHLQDVATLISLLFWVGLFACIAWLIGLVAIRKFKLTYPRIKNILSGMGAIILVSATLLSLIGPTKIFYWLHTKIFPAGHQWYFYYQESLMATFMKAPDLFGFIAILLTAFIILIFSLACIASKRIAPR